MACSLFPTLPYLGKRRIANKRRVPYDRHMASDFAKLFYPSSVAIVGASVKPDSVGNSLRHNLNTFKGAVYYVNPNHTDLDGTVCYPSVSKLPAPVDLAVIATPAASVPSIVEEAGKFGIKHLVVISAGFRETGPEGAKLEEEAKDLSLKYDVTLVGPNCLGIMNPEIGLNTSFAGDLPMDGSIAFVSQSGALMTAILDYAKKWRLGFSKCVSTGNKATVDETDLLSYLATDEKTKVILLYVEDISDASRFITAAKKVSCVPSPKPIIFLKSGRTKEGSHASASHTGALGGVDAYYSALARQSGSIRVATISEFLSSAMVASSNVAPKGSHVAIVTNAGGPGVLITDEAIDFGLHLAELSAASIEKLQSQLPETARVHNPVDILGDAKAERYESATRTLLADPAVDSLLVLLTPQSGTEITKTAEVVAGLPTDKPVIASFMGQDAVTQGITILRGKGIAVTEYPEDAARALGRFSAFAARGCPIPSPFSYGHMDAERVRSILWHLPNTEGFIPEREAGLILSAYGFPILTTIQAASTEETVAAVQKIGVPCAVKISSPAISHKRDVGGVILNVTANTASDAYETIMKNVRAHVPEARVDGVIVKEMAPLGLECILGIVKQPHFGTMVMVGMGGTYVEVTKDVAFGVLPIDLFDAKEMIASLHARALFDGYRGTPALDVDALIDGLGRLGRLAQDFPEISEIDINPFTLYPKGKGAKVVDVRMKLA